MHKFSQLMQYFQVAISIDVIAGDFKYDILKVSKKDSNHFKIVNKLTQILAWLTDRFYIKKNLMGELSTNVTMKIIYFSDRDGVRILYYSLKSNHILNHLVVDHTIKTKMVGISSVNYFRYNAKLLTGI